MIRSMSASDPHVIDTNCLLEWCREYQKHGPHPRPDLDRFCIGTYQISQALSWDIAGPVAWQSWCAACLHFMMAAEAKEVWLEKCMPQYVINYSEICTPFDYILRVQGRAMQHMVYSTPRTGAHWRKRYNVTTLRESLGALISTCFQMVPKDYRAQGIADEMSLICSDVVIR